MYDEKQQQQQSADAISEKDADDRSRSASARSPFSLSGLNFGGLGDTARMLSSKAVESLRYVTIQKESHDSHDAGEMTQELAGKRVWKVGGVGVMVYEGEGRAEEKKNEVWRAWSEKGMGKDEWFRAARARTNQYQQGESCGFIPFGSEAVLEHLDMGQVVGARDRRSHADTC